ncbi:MAG: hypothetical protein ACE5IP_09875 [Terriglobia bacterium]
MAAELQVVENPIVVVVPPPGRGGRYQVEFRGAPAHCACGHHSQQALLWLIFVEAGREAGREVSDVICAKCDPARYARVESWAHSLA